MGKKKGILQKSVVNKSYNLLIWKLSTAICVLVTIAASVFLLIKIVRDIEIVSVKSETSSVMQSNIENIPKLNDNINTLKTDANLLRLVANPNDTVFIVINNALPDEEDAIALAAMIQNNIFGGIGSKVEQVVVGSSKINNNIGEIDISFTISGDFEQIIKSQRRLENSIRPFIIRSLNLSKNDQRYRAIYTATTFYIPATKFAIDEKEIAKEKILVLELVNPEIKKPDPRIFGETAINPNSWKQQGVEDGLAQ